MHVVSMAPAEAMTWMDVVFNGMLGGIAVLMMAGGFVGLTVCLYQMMKD